MKMEVGRKERQGEDSILSTEGRFSQEVVDRVYSASSSKHLIPVKNLFKSQL